MRIEHKAASAAVAAGGVIDSDDPYTHTIIASVTGIKDEVNDILVPGCYTKTLRERKPKVIKDHDWAKRLGRVVEIKELLPGDPGLPKTTAQGKAWPAEAGALVAKVRLFQGTVDGDEAAARWREEGPEQQFSIGYAVPKGKATVRAGVRHVHELKCLEISDVLWGAMPIAGIMPDALVSKMLTGGPAGDGVGDEIDVDLTDPDVLEQQLEEGLSDGSDTDLEEIANKAACVPCGEGEQKAAVPAPRSAASVWDDLEAKYDTSPVGSPGDRENWVDKVGGLPKYIRAIAHALIRQGRSEQQAIEIAVGTVRRWARGGGKVSEKTRAKAAAALAEWEEKKARARAKAGTSRARDAAGTKAAEPDLGGWRPDLEVGEHAAHAGEPVEVKSASRLPGTVEERLDAVREAVVRRLRGAERETSDGIRRYEWDHVNIDGTYPDHVIATRFRWDGGADDTESYEVAYSWAADGEVMLGDPERVTLTLTVVEESGVEAKGVALDVDAVSPAVLALTDAAAMAARGLQGVETKAGRVLSAANQARLQAALQSLVDVLAAAGVHLGKDDGDEAPQKPAQDSGKPKAPVETKASDDMPVLVGLGDLPDPRALVAQLYADAHG